MTRRRRSWHWCHKCEDFTYWKNGRCQRCRVEYIARLRGWLIVAACILVFASSILSLWWKR